MRIRSSLVPAGLAIALAASSPAAAQSPARLVIVNGAVMNEAQLLVLDAVNCGSPVPDGRYWLDANTGAWGFQGDPQQGVIGAQCRAAQAPRQTAQSECQARYKYWEDRMANCYGVSAYQNPAYR